MRRSRRERRLSGLDESAPDRVADKTGDLVDAELDHEVTAMGLGGLLGDPEDFSDFLGRIAFGHELQDFALSRGEKVGGEPALTAVGRHHHLRYRRADVELAAGDVPDRLD